MALLAQLRRKARGLKSETVVLYLALRHPSTPLYAKLVVAGVVAYVLSPIDLIPDFIPVLGLLDDLVLVPLGIKLALSLVPAPVLLECRSKAELWVQRGKRIGRIAAWVIGALWVLLLLWLCVWVYRRYSGGAF